MCTTAHCESVGEDRYQVSTLVVHVALDFCTLRDCVYRSKTYKVPHAVGIAVRNLNDVSGAVHDREDLGRVLLRRK